MEKYMRAIENYGSLKQWLLDGLGFVLVMLALGSILVLGA